MNSCWCKKCGRMNLYCQCGDYKLKFEGEI